MPGKSSIEWTDRTWNPVTGCTKVSSGCANCYAERFAERWRGIPGHAYEQGFDLRLWPERLHIPRTWRKPCKIFVNSMSDLFHERIECSFIERVFETMVACPQHQFQILTKRSSRVRELRYALPWPAQIWMGVSIENESFLFRASDLRTVPATCRFLSLEPLIGPLDALDLDGIDWVIVGGESGPGARLMQPDWVRTIRDLAEAAEVPFFFKQWGGRVKTKGAPVLDDETHQEFPFPMLLPPRV